jgi:hypothetical protein
MDPTQEESLEQIIESLRTSLKSIPEVDCYKQANGWSDPYYGAVPPLTVHNIDGNINGTTYNNISLNGSVLQAGTTSSNAIWTTTGTGGYTISNPYTTNSGGKIHLQGEKADIDINGKSLKTWMERVEERLNILQPNDKLEEEWEELKALGEQYRRLEQHIRDKQATWDRLKAMPPPVAE